MTFSEGNTMEATKPGIKTTEFYLSVLIGSLLVGLAMFLETAGNHLGGALTAIAATIVPGIYAAGRSRLKLEQQRAESRVQEKPSIESLTSNL